MRFTNNPFLTSQAGFSLDDKPRWGEKQDRESFRTQLKSGKGYLVKRDNVVANRYYFKKNITDPNKASLADYTEHSIAATKEVENLYRRQK